MKNIRGVVMVRENGMVMISEKEYKEMKLKLNELEYSNKLLRSAILQLTRKQKENYTDVKVSREDFIKIHQEALDIMCSNENMESVDVYGRDFTVHWHGIYCSCADGATPSNHIIPAVQACLDEIGNID